jgi:hypothetical protein
MQVKYVYPLKLFHLFYTLSMKFLIALLSVVMLFSCGNAAKNQGQPEEVSKAEQSISDLQNGDILFQTSNSSQSKAIQAATKSAYSHVGILYKIKGELFVYEAIGPVKLTPLKAWIAQGEGKDFVAKRLKNADEILDIKTLQKMQAVGEDFRGKSYDLLFAWDDTQLYCSELVWKIYKRGAGIEVGQPVSLKEFDLSSGVVQEKLKERYGNKIPLDEKVISPAAIFRSEKLVTVYTTTKN